MEQILLFITVALGAAALTFLTIFVFADYIAWAFRGKLISPDGMISEKDCMEVADMEADEVEKNFEKTIQELTAELEAAKQQNDHMVKENINLTSELEAAQNVNTIYNERLKRLLDNLRAESITTAFMRKTKANIRDHFIQKLNSIQNHMTSLNQKEYDRAD